MLGYTNDQQLPSLVSSHRMTLGVQLRSRVLYNPDMSLFKSVTRGMPKVLYTLRIDWKCTQMKLHVNMLKNIFLLHTSMYITLAMSMLSVAFSLHIKRQNYDLKYLNVLVP